MITIVNFCSIIWIALLGFDSAQGYTKPKTDNQHCYQEGKPYVTICGNTKSNRDFDEDPNYAFQSVFNDYFSQVRKRTPWLYIVSMIKR